MKLRNVFRSKSSANADPDSTSRRSARTAGAPPSVRHTRTVIDPSASVKPPTLKRRERRPDPLDGRTSSHNRRAKQDVIDRKKPATKRAVKARPVVKKKLGASSNSSSVPSSNLTPRKAARAKAPKGEMSELDRILNGDAPMSAQTPKRKKKSLDDVLARGRMKSQSGASTVGGGRSVASRKSLKSRSASKGPNRKAKPSSNPQGGSDENTSANSDTINSNGGKQSIRSSRSTRTAPPVMDAPSPRSRRRSKSRARLRELEDHIGADDIDADDRTSRTATQRHQRASSPAKGDQSPYHTPRTTKAKLVASKASKVPYDDPSLMLSPAEKRLKDQIDRVKKDVDLRKSPKHITSNSANHINNNSNNINHRSPKPSTDETTSNNDDDDIFASPKAMPVVSQQVDEDEGADKESYFRQRIQHYQSEFFSMQVQLTEAQAQVTKLLDLRKKDKGRLEDAAEKFIELKTTSKQSKAEVQHLNDRIYDLEDSIVRKEKEAERLREEVETKLDKIDDLERQIEDRDDPILSNYSTTPSNEEQIRDLRAWEEELKAKEERLSAESTFDNLKLKQMEEREADLRAREAKIQADELLLQQKQRTADESESKYHRQMRRRTSNEGSLPGDAVKIQQLQKEITEKDFQLEKASKAFVKMEKKHGDALQKMRDGMQSEFESKEKEFQALQRKLKHEQRLVDQLKAGGATVSGTALGDDGVNKEEVIAELKLELAKMEDELNANDPVGYASKLKTEVMLLKEQNRIMKTQLEEEQEDTQQKLQKKDETIAFMQNELVKIKMNGGKSIAGISGLGAALTDSGEPNGSISSYGSPTTVIEQNNSNFDGNRSFTGMFSKIGQKREQRRQQQQQQR